MQYLARFLAVSLLTSSGVAPAAEPFDFWKTPSWCLGDGSPQGRFGNSVAIDGDVAVVGATDGASMPEQSRPGAAYAFERQSNGTWRQTAKLLPATEDGTSNFGTSVAIEGDVIVVARYFSPLTAVFERQNGVWTRVATLGDTGGVDVGIRNGDHHHVVRRRRGPVSPRRQWLGEGTKTTERRSTQADADYAGPAVRSRDNYAIHGVTASMTPRQDRRPGTAYLFTRRQSPLDGCACHGHHRPAGWRTGRRMEPSSWVDIDGSTAIIAAYPAPYLRTKCAYPGNVRRGQR